MSILKRMLLSIGLVVAVTVAMGITLTWVIFGLGQQLDAASYQPIQKVDAARSAWDQFRTTQQIAEKALEGVDFDTTVKAMQEFGRALAETEHQIDRIRQIQRSPAEDAALTRMAVSVQAWKNNALAMLGRQPATAIPAPHVMEASAAESRAAVSAMVESTLQAAANVRAEVEATVRTSLVSAVALILLCVLGGSALAFRSAMRVTRPLSSLEASMRAMAQGRIDITLPETSSKDEIGSMARALGVLQESLVKVRALEEQGRVATAARIARAESMASVVSDVGEVVAAAANGDFSARLQMSDADEEMQKLVAGINKINSVVDNATTEFAQSLQAVAEGDLTQRIDTAYLGRFAELKGAINDTVDRLSATVRTIQLTSADVGLAAREINIGADDLSKRTEEQASSLEETAATTEELAASVKASAHGARQAATIAQEALAAAQSGGTIAGQAVDAMTRIESASQKISDIIRVIDDIAFQTNLLALNAAVEAARAGDAGKGFAVVASEVRTLAQRSSSAAKDISGLISSSNQEVGEGVKLVRQAGDALTKIREASERVAATIAEISAASAEQASGIDEMSQAVAHLDEMTQANAALAEESAASAGSLSGKIEQLNELVATFRTERDGAAAHQRAMPAPTEPERLRNLAKAAFAPAKPLTAAATLAAAPRAPARKVANSRAGNSGWEESESVHPYIKQARGAL